ncbi:phosphoribosylanthranilate isomerase [Sulfurimonas sp. HSL3-7]|uniref:phosphoribosylanthranilate isomerase n=1 Tax=Sulfonitrofixus jiaomeiensis TaxID=3131938 RepID=UPI0031F936B4
MYKVKICGITSYHDAIMAVEAGADALGFVFYPQSPRYISPQDAKNIIERLPPFVEKVGLFVNEDADTINAISQQSGITLAQIHFEAPQETLDELRVPYIMVTRAKSEDDIAELDGRYRLVDAYCEAYGGMGKRLNLDWFKGKDNRHIILAGGLSPENVHETLQYGFYGVDVSSSVEKEKGVKDPEKVRTFIANAKKSAT